MKLMLTLILGVMAGLAVAAPDTRPVDEVVAVAPTPADTPHQDAPTADEIFDRVETYYNNSWQGFMGQVGIWIAILVGVVTLVVAVIGIVLPFKQSRAVKEMKAKIEKVEKEAEEKLRESNETMGTLVKAGQEQAEQVQAATDHGNALQRVLLERNFANTANLFASHVAMQRQAGINLGELSPAELESLLKPFLTLANNAILAGAEAKRSAGEIAGMFPAVLSFLEMIPDGVLILQQDGSKFRAGAFLETIEKTSSLLQDVDFSVKVQELRSVLEQKCKDREVFLACIEAVTQPNQE